MMYMELKKAIIDWLIENKNAWQRVNACHDAFSHYIYKDGKYIIGGKDVSDFISAANKLLYD